MTVLCGPSGSGKSTLLNIIGSELRPNQGLVNYTAPPRVAWVFQSAPLLLARTALENAAIGALGRGASINEAHSSARKTLSNFGLEGRMSTPARALSGGERQRVSIARALEGKASILLADEPTAALDSSAATAVIEALLLAATNGACVVVATHDPNVMRSAHCRYSIRDGHIAPG